MSTQLTPGTSVTAPFGAVSAPLTPLLQVPASVGLASAHWWTVGDSGDCRPRAMLAGIWLPVGTSVRGNFRVPKFPALEPAAHSSTTSPTRIGSASLDR